MDHHAILNLALFISIFLGATALLQIVSNKVSFPYTVALLISGFVTQVLVHVFHLDFHLTLSPDIIFFFLLPVLLFEAAMHINIHQFKIQFKTISFIATFGLLVSVFSIGFLLSWLAGLPFPIALLFGAIISATDPIAVLALFKSLGAPKRLALLADGESMFNDATGVIAFRIISAFVVAGQQFSTFKVLGGLGSFLYVFLGAIVVGAVFGLLASYLFSRVKEDKILIGALTTALGIGSFVVAEHNFHVSGVITTVIAGIIFGNFGLTRIPSKTIHFLEEFWAYFGFLSLSLVFFFAAFNLDLNLFSQNIGLLFLVIAVVLIARSLSVYISALITNYMPGFQNEPDMPLKWQHILNWGGLRGVIPLVLVYSLPDTFEYKQLMLQFTMATLLFTLFVNGLTIKWLLVKLGLHLPLKEEQIIADEIEIFHLEEKRKKLAALPKKEFDPQIIKHIDADLAKAEKKYRDDLVRLATPEEFLLSLKLQALQVERETMRKLYDAGRFPEGVYHEFNSELDIQQDTLEYPEVYTRTVDEEGRIIMQTDSYRKRLASLRKFISTFPLLSRIVGLDADGVVASRYSKLRARIFTSYAAVEYLDRVEKILNKKNVKQAVDAVRKIQKSYISKNSKEAGEIEKKYPRIVKEYQKNIINNLISSEQH